MFRVSERTIYYWCSGRTPIPAAVAAVVRAVMTEKIEYRDIWHLNYENNDEDRTHSGGRTGS